MKFAIYFQLEKFLPILETLHPQFANVVYCAPFGTRPPVQYKDRFLYFDRVYFDNEQECDACLSLLCFELAESTGLYKDSSGYLLIGDDTFTLHKNPMLKEHFDKIWARQKYAQFNLATGCHSEWGLPEPTNCSNSYFLPWYQRTQLKAARNALEFLRSSSDLLYKKCSVTLEKDFHSKDVIFYQPTIVDFVHIPREKLNSFVKLLRVFTLFQVIHEIALPNVVKCLDPNGNGTLNATGFNELFGYGRWQVENYPNIFIQKAMRQNMTHVHLVKLLGLLQHEGLAKQKGVVLSQEKMSRIKNTYCDIIVPYIYEA